MKIKKQFYYFAGASILLASIAFFSYQEKKQRQLYGEVSIENLNYLYEDTLTQLDALALTKSAVVQSYTIDKASIHEKNQQIFLDLKINRSDDHKVHLELAKDKEGDFTITKSTPSTALQTKLEAKPYKDTLKEIENHLQEVRNRDKWDEGIRTAYYEHVRQKMKKAKLTQLTDTLNEMSQEAKEIGSAVYTDFFVWSDLSSREKLSLVLEHMQAEIDQYHFLQMGTNGYRFSKTLEPTSDFYSFFRQEILKTYKTKEGLKADELGEKLHLFRSHIDKQAIDYIRDNFDGANDYEKLLNYTRQKNIKVDYTTGAVFHNRTYGEFSYTQNMKVQVPQANISGNYGTNNARFIEYIVNINTGNFVSEWNVYRQLPDGTYDSNPDHYTIEEGGDAANTESANYGLSKGLNKDVPVALARTHGSLDVSHPADTDIRRKMTKKWRPAASLNKGGRYADLVKKGGTSDVKRWREIEDEDRLQAYNDFIASTSVGDGFDLFYQRINQEQTSNN
ncbi:hypothetical protein STRDD10_00499 [Streptococcus sp. DD10]|uniref:DUF1310 family protein n=1 Tax=Streptococcus sp. DD10 TaxID=1777878 RepID=UPI000792F902|nr:DUF1310 family protein [Streptococcus sp. DD10]KXT75091.1 hypothetical protein STRDD10_00499 [Streptococcus sp. DD10]